MLKRRLGAFTPVLILALLGEWTEVSGAQNAAAPAALRYSFTRGQKRTYTIQESTTETIQGAGASDSGGDQVNRNGVVLEVLSVALDGSAEFRFSYDFIRILKPIAPGLALTIDTRRPIRETNPDLRDAGPEGEPALKMLETTHQVINKVFIHAPLRFTVTDRGRVTRVVGIEEVWDTYRTEAGKVVTDPAKRAEMDVLIEGFFGEKAVKKTIGDNFFILLPEGPVTKGHEWTDKFTYEFGEIHLPLSKIYRLESEPGATPLRVGLTIEFGDPPPTEEVVLKLTRNRLEGAMTVDLQDGFIPACRYRGELEFGVYAADDPSERLAQGNLSIDGVIASRLWKNGQPPESEEVTLFNEGVEHFREKRYTDAIESFRKALEARPGWAEPYERIGVSSMFLDREEDAIEAFLEAVRLEPRALTYQNLGAAYNKMGDYYLAPEVLNKAVAMDPTLIQSYRELGEAYRRMDQFEEAIEAYANVLRLDPKDGSSHFFMGFCYREMGKFEDAIRELREAARIEPNDARGHFTLAETYAAAKRKDEAVSSFKKAVALDLKSARYRTEFARFYFENEQFAEAAEMLKESIALEPKSVDARLGLAASYIRLGKKELALQQAGEIEKLDPETAEMIRETVAQEK